MAKRAESNIRELADSSSSITSILNATNFDPLKWQSKIHPAPIEKRNLKTKRDWVGSVA